MKVYLLVNNYLNMNRNNFTISVTGLRKHKLNFAKTEYVIKESEIINKLIELINPYIDIGYDTFLTGMATGSDTMFAKAIIEIKKKRDDLILNAVIPFVDQPKQFSLDERKEYNDILKKCEVIRIIDNEYKKDCYLKRNEYLVKNSSVLFAITDDINLARSGTTFTINRAIKEGIEVVVINPYTLELSYI